MSFSGSRRVLFSTTLLALLIISVLQIWVWCEYSCQAGAIRILPGNGIAKVMKVGGSHGGGMVKKSSKEDLVRKHFNGRTDNRFEENKRKVPSCPDPLHN
ncbi:CLAVATA3/ESR (CLE)-related protein 27-like [Juglans microcarpa x Juglans regia]|uniref:CLAVATA3/ESR (CLE)-related protein 27-like n=1 Tax=Juglans microcarpa x Juglans regia TaxID=2249226 RepID=UPI001B7DB1D4|nr:CLAVATA3/ESR (CLE)-related protein 27-like [Juglans microcarpa x Juglans regia]